MNRNAPQPGRIRRLGLITSQAFSLHNFRGPLIREWVARGIHVLALAPDYDDASRQGVAALGAEPVEFRLERASIRPLRDTLDLIALTRLLRSLDLDATLTYFIKPVVYGTLAARLAGIGHRFAMVEGAGYVFSEAKGGASPSQRLLRQAVTLMYRAALRGADAVFFLNADDVELFRGRRMVASGQVVQLGGIGVELDRFAMAPPVLAPVTFILAARLLAHKGVYDFVEAARRMRSQHPEVRFLLLGSPDVNPASVSERQLRDWMAEGVVEWQAHVPDVRPWLARASVYVLPSWYREGVPRGIQEAMAMGRPIVTTDMPGCRDTVEHGVNGLLVPPHDPDALVAALSRFIATPQLIADMGRASRARAEALFDVRRVNALVLRSMGLETDIEQ
ncbi:MAG: glycosyltransferase family 4 protein [Chromatiaceae bacterium]|nr:glycosyltransferase family 4 protein [Chromatiaceae bacterium]